jgi:hypothetical protein
MADFSKALPPACGASKGILTRAAGCSFTYHVSAFVPSRAAATLRPYKNSHQPDAMKFHAEYF